MIIYRREEEEERFVFRLLFTCRELEPFVNYSATQAVSAPILQIAFALMRREKEDQ